MAKRNEDTDAQWQLKELLALECALAKDERAEWASLKERDAAMEIEESIREGGSRRALVWQWLGERMKREADIELASGSIVQSLGIAGQLFCVIGALGGIASATAALAYTGEAPINVSMFLAVFVLTQALLAVVLAICFVIPGKGKRSLSLGPLFRLGWWGFEVLFSRVQALAGRFLSGQQRNQAAEMAGAARRAFALHGRTAKWIVFSKIQGAAFWFNAGVLVALLVAVAFSDRAFGWQTTLAVSSESVADLCRVIALPWSWWQGEGLGFPTLEQVEGSRIVLKDGIQSLETPVLASWWRFLALGVVVYGMLPRAVFNLLGRWRAKVAIARFDFKNASVERLVRRLRPVRRGFEAESVDRGEVSGEELGGEARFDEVQAARKVCCLISQELASIVSEDALRAGLASRWELPEVAISVKLYELGEMQVEASDSEEGRQLAVVFESWMPPIREIERQIRQLRNAVSPTTLIQIVLLGVPDGDGATVNLRPDRQYAETWHSFVRRLGDPYIILDNPSV